MKIRSKTKSLQSGLTLVELMIAMTIGLVLISGALFVYSNARAAYSTNEGYALMQENARFALSVLEPDIQMAGYWGQHRNPATIKGSAIDRGAGTAFSGVANDCGENWVVQFDQHIEGYNDVTGTVDELDCIAANSIFGGSDVFAIRRVEEEPATALTAGTLYMRSNELPSSELFIGNNEPTATLPDPAENFEVVANAYYVKPGDESSAVGSLTRQPALRQVSLTNAGGGMVMQDNEITTGIEDMQIQYGIGPPDARGVRSAVNVYVSDIENLTPPNTVVRSMRIWLLMRAEREEFDYIDDVQYRLGDKVTIARDDNYRRLVVSKTVFFRNLH